MTSSEGWAKTKRANYVKTKIKTKYKVKRTSDERSGAYKNRV